LKSHRFANRAALLSVALFYDDPTHCTGLGIHRVVHDMLCTLQAGRYFNQAQYDKQCQKRVEQCIEKQKDDEAAALAHKDEMELLREEFMNSSTKKYNKARLRDKVSAQLKLHKFSLEDRRDK